MKMNKPLIALCLSGEGSPASAPGISLADVNYVPQNTSDAPAIPSAALQQLTWTPVDPEPKTQTTEPATGGQQLNVPGISWSGCCVQRPGKHWRTDPDADQRSEQTNQRFCAERADSHQNMTPSAFFPSYFTYQEPGVMSADWLEGVMRWRYWRWGSKKSLCSGLYHGKRSPADDPTARPG